MKKLAIISAGFTAIAALGITGGCSGDPETALPPVTPHAMFERLPYTAEAPPDNPMTDEKIELGHKLYFEPKLSRSGIISCNTCHVVGAAGVDHRAIAIGEGARLGRRNSPTVFDSAFLKMQFWDGRAETLEEQAKLPIQAHEEMDLTPEEAVTRLSRTGYMPYFKKAFPDEDKPLTFENIAKAIATFERTLISRNAPFDQYLDGQYDALNEKELAGMILFQNGCIICHQGPLLGGDRIMPFDALGGDDRGVGELTGNPADDYHFRVSPLRNVALTYPYMHDGSVETLEEAVDLMAETQLHRVYSDEEREQVTAFLRALTGKFPEIIHPLLPRDRHR